jgi:hypothetical protein
MEKKLKKLLIGFFIFMLIFTFVSRAAASVTLAQVTVFSPKRGNLNYEQSGTGTIKENAEKYIKLEAGYKISKINKKTGDRVEKKELLFTYDTGQLKELLSARELELKKLKLQYDKNSLSPQNTDSSLDLEAALLQEENAQSDLADAIAELDTIKESVNEKKTKEYEESVAALKELETGKADALRPLNRDITDTESSLTQAKEPLLKLEDILTVYSNAVKSKKEGAAESAYTAVFEFYYDNKYKEHKQQIETATKNLNRLKEDLASTTRKWDATIDYQDQYSAEDSVRKAYQQQISARNSEVTACNRAIEDAQETLDKLQAEDSKLDTALLTYKDDLENGYLNRQKDSYQSLYRLLYDHLAIKETDIRLAKEKADRAQEDAKAAEKEWDEKIRKARIQAETLESDIQAIKKGSYDYSKDIKDARKAEETARRTLETAKLQREKLEAELTVKQSNEETSKLTISLDQSMLQLDINSKEEEIAKLNKVIAQKGRVYSPVQGIIGNSGLDYGITLTGSEKLVILTGGFELVMKGNKDNLKYFSEGDEIEIKSYDTNTPFTSSIETLGLPDEEGLVTFTALLPDGNYKEGGSLTYRLKKASQEYPNCVPLQAIRQDAGSRTYVLMVKEKATVLGTEQTAFRMDVTVEEKDRNTAAISGSFTSEDIIITGSSKDISEGDRVMANETE